MMKSLTGYLSLARLLLFLPLDRFAVDAAPIEEPQVPALAPPGAAAGALGAVLNLNASIPIPSTFPPASPGPAFDLHFAIHRSQRISARYTPWGLAQALDRSWSQRMNPHLGEGFKNIWEAETSVENSMPSVEIGVERVFSRRGQSEPLTNAQVGNMIRGLQREIEHWHPTSPGGADENGIQSVTFVLMTPRPPTPNERPEPLLRGVIRPKPQLIAQVKAWHRSRLPSPAGGAGRSGSSSDADSQSTAFGLEEYLHAVAGFSLLMQTRVFRHQELAAWTSGNQYVLPVPRSHSSSSSSDSGDSPPGSPSSSSGSSGGGSRAPSSGSSGGGQSTQMLRIPMALSPFAGVVPHAGVSSPLILHKDVAYMIEMIKRAFREAETGRPRERYDTLTWTVFDVFKTRSRSRTIGVAYGAAGQHRHQQGDALAWTSVAPSYGS